MSNGSLFNQFYYVIKANFCPNLNKHSYKKQHHKKVKIASYSYRGGLISFSSNFSKYLKKKFGVRFIKEIQQDHIESFFNDKLKDGCSKRTLMQYKSYLNTLDKLILQTYFFKARLGRNVVVKDGAKEKRILYMKDEHIDAILELKKDTNSSALLGIEINRLFGLRAEETVSLRAKDFDLEECKLHIFGGKNGKYRFMYLNTQEKYDLALRVREMFEDNERLIPIKAESYCTFIRRALEELNIEEYKLGKTSNHALRKKYAIDSLELYKERGMSDEDAKLKISREFGHNRISVIEDSYINAK